MRKPNFIESVKDFTVNFIDQIIEKFSDWWGNGEEKRSFENVRKLAGLVDRSGDTSRRGMFTAVRLN